MATQYPGDKDKAPTQEQYKKAWADVESGKQKAPSFDDSGPLPDPKKGATEGATKGGMAPAIKKMAKGGSASSRADGCAIKGKTKGKIV
jgi:hypothetical protein